MVFIGERAMSGGSSEAGEGGMEALRAIADALGFGTSRKKMGVDGDPPAVTGLKALACGYSYGELYSVIEGGGGGSIGWVSVSAGCVSCRPGVPIAAVGAVIVAPGAVVPAASIPFVDADALSSSTCIAAGAASPNRSLILNVLSSGMPIAELEAALDLRLSTVSAVVPYPLPGVYCGY
jgi:hypothetical protein